MITKINNTQLKYFLIYPFSLAIIMLISVVAFANKFYLQKQIITDITDYSNIDVENNTSIYIYGKDVLASGNHLSN